MSSGISKKTKEQYDYILELLRQPMTVREVAEHMGMDLYLMHRHFYNLKKSKCVKEGELRIIKGRRASYTFTATGTPYIHAMTSRAKQYEDMRNDIVAPAPTLPNAVVYGMQNPKLTQSYRAQQSQIRSEYKSPKNYASSNSMAMF